MNKIDQLFIRACKSLEPDTRLRSVLRRLYLKTSDVFMENRMLADKLITIVDNNFPMRVGEYLRHKCDYDTYCRMSGGSPSDVEKNIWIMRDYIRHQTRDKLESLGCVTPLKFRIKENK